MNNPEFERLLDAEYLRLLRIGYLIGGGISAFATLFGVFYVVLGAILASAMHGPGRGGGGPPPAFMGLLFIMIGLGIVVIAGILATLKFLTARALRLRRARVLCFITAGLSCLSIPYGTALGILTFMVLGRPGVRSLFDGEAEPASMPPPVAGSAT